MSKSRFPLLLLSQSIIKNSLVKETIDDLFDPVVPYTPIGMEQSRRRFLSVNDALRYSDRYEYHGHAAIRQRKLICYYQRLYLGL